MNSASTARVLRVVRGPSPSFMGIQHTEGVLRVEGSHGNAHELEAMAKAKRQEAQKLLQEADMLSAGALLLQAEESKAMGPEFEGPAASDLVAMIDVATWVGGYTGRGGSQSVFASIVADIGSKCREVLNADRTAQGTKALMDHPESAKIVTALQSAAKYTGEGFSGTDWQAIVADLGQEMREVLKGNTLAARLRAHRALAGSEII